MARKSSKKNGSLESKIFSLFLFIAIFVVTNLVLSYGALFALGLSVANLSALEYPLDVMSSISFPLSVIIYLLATGKKPRELIAQMGLSRSGFNLRSLKYGLALFAALIFFELFVGLVSTSTGIALPSNIGSVFCGAPLYFLFFSVFVTPVDEEVFFRGFLVPRLGIVVSALIFAVLHLSYLSVSEFGAAFVFGLLAGYVFKKLNSVYPTIFAHAAVNGLSLASLLLTGTLCFS